MANRRTGFTLVELLITIMVIGLMAGMLGFAMFAAQETAKVHKTKALIAKLDAIIKAKYESYITRRVPVNIQEEFNDLNGNGLPEPGEFEDANGNGICNTGEYVDANGNGQPDAFPPKVRAQIRLEFLRDLMRMEMPDRWTDIEDGPTPFTYTLPSGPVTVSVPRPSVSIGFKRRYDAIVNRASPPPPSASALGANASSECLYQIIMQAQQDDADDRSVIKEDMKGDTDGDGFPEILDAWGTPIRFIRWPAGFDSELNVVAHATPQSVSGGIPRIVTVQSAALSQEQGAYLGGAVARFYAQPLDSVVLPDSLAKILDYSTTPSLETFTVVSTGSPVATGQPMIVFAPDPFDPAGASPKPSFATYPLIYSSGPDKAPGICNDFDTASPVHYNSDRVNPCIKGTDNSMNPPSVVFIGTQRDDDKLSTGRQWADNIHNHLITAR